MDKHILDEFGETTATRIIQQQKQFSPNEVEEIVSLYRSGSTTYALAEKYHCPRSRISKILKDNGVTPSKNKVSKNLDVKAIISLYKEYHTAEEIGVHFGVHRNIIIRLLRENNIPIRSRWDYPKK